MSAPITSRLPRPRCLTCGILTVILPFLLLLVACGSFVTAGAISPFLTYHVAPAPYPGSQVVSSFDGGGTGGTWRQTTYRVPVDMQTVYQAYERDMPGFFFGDLHVTEFQQQLIRGYQNYKCNESGLARFVQSLLANNAFPFSHCITVSIYPAPDQPTTTIIHYWAFWPSG